MYNVFGRSSKQHKILILWCILLLLELRTKKDMEAAKEISNKETSSRIYPKANFFFSRYSNTAVSQTSAPILPNIDCCAKYFMNI
jgi:hypothetical protein